MDSTLQCQCGHFVEMEMSADERVRTENMSKFVDTIGQFEYSAHRGLGGGGAHVIFHVAYPSLQDQRSRSREAYCAEPLKYASPTAFTCRDTRCAM